MNEIPQIITSGRRDLFSDDVVRISILYNSGPIILRMYAKHSQFKDVCPVNTASCKRHKKSKEHTDTVFELPDKYGKMFIKYLEELQDKHNLIRKERGNDIGVCTECFSFEGDNLICFEEELTKINIDIER